MCIFTCVQQLKRQSAQHSAQQALHGISVPLNISNIKAQTLFIYSFYLTWQVNLTNYFFFLFAHIQKRHFSNKRLITEWH